MVWGGKLSPSLLNLKHLTHLDLSFNDFQGAPIPSFLGSLDNLRYLNLSCGGFGGTIPHQLGNLSGLQSLDLNYGLGLNTISLEWASGLSSLQFLGLNGVDLGRASDWMQVTSRLPSLQQLHLSNCNPPYINTPTSPPPAINFSSLAVLDLSGNSLYWVPRWIFTLPALTSLSLSYNNLRGPIPVGLGNLTGLTVLELHSNRFNSTLPKWLFDDLNKLEHLDLGWNGLHGRIPEAVGNMTSLASLDLSYNQLNSSLPRRLFDLKKLEDLDLGWNGLQGGIPKAIGNMTSLTNLDLTRNMELQGGGSLFKWLGNLCRLRRVELSGIKFGFIKDVNISSSTGCTRRALVELSMSRARLSGHFSDLADQLGQFKSLDSLQTLDLSDNQLVGQIPESIGTSSFLETLDLSYNQLADTIPASIGRLSFLETLDLSHNQLAGPIPEFIGTSFSMKTLYLSHNQLNGPIPESIGRLSFLETLDLSHNQLAGPIPTSIGTLLSLQVLLLHNNQLNGTLPESLGQLINLKTLYTSYNPMAGDVTEIHFASLAKLTGVEALGNRFSFKVRPSWVPPFQLLYLRLDSWQVGPQFPLWLRSQTNLSQLQMSRSGITSAIPNWFPNSFPRLAYLNLSQSQIHGDLGESLLSLPYASVIDLSSNQFSGVLPLVSPNLRLLNLSDNYFSGSISSFLCHKPHELKSLVYLNLQNNQLSGELPDCWTNWTSLTIVRFGSNEFTGKVPRSIGFLHGLQSLHLENNQLQGEIPASLGNCKMLIGMDLGENNFAGSIPTWIGKGLADLKLLRLRSNKFDGKIPYQICALTSLQVLDLAHNNLYGSIPECFDKLKAMTTIQRNATISIYVSEQGYLDEVAQLVWKGITFEFNKILGLMISMDLSSNNLSREIPRDLVTLVGMRSLNLSNNFLTGKIPKEIGDMQLLESIDFSHNQISGQIPWSMSTLTFLCYLDMANNNLVGQIPTSTQLQSFNPSSYGGNMLCGPPVTNNCNSTTPKVNREEAKEEDEMKVYMIYGSMAIGFVMGFWIIWGPLLFIKSWRAAYFKSLESLYQKIQDIGSTCY